MIENTKMKEKPENLKEVTTKKWSLKKTFAVYSSQVNWTTFVLIIIFTTGIHLFHTF